VDARGRNGYRGIQQASLINVATNGVSASTGGGLPRGFQVRQYDGNNLNNIDMDHWGIGPLMGSIGVTTTQNSNDNNNNTGSAGHREAGGAEQRARRSQARAARYRSSGGRYMQQVHSRLKSFRRGTDKYNCKIRPSREDILCAADKEAEALGATSVTTIPLYSTLRQVSASLKSGLQFGNFSRPPPTMHVASFPPLNLRMLFGFLWAT
jgi:hypothetical protein